MNDCKPNPNDQSGRGLPWSMPLELEQIARDGGAELISELFAIFQDDSAARLQALCDAIADHNSDVIRGQAHSLKGSASQIGARPMAALCQQMEGLARAGTVHEQEVLFEEIETSFAQVKERLSALDPQTFVAEQGISR